MQELVLCLVLALLVGFFVWATGSKPPLDPGSPQAPDSYYNLLVQGFSEGHLYIKRDAPAGLSQLANPYDPVANAPYLRALNDLSYYKGKLYLYFGVTPALVLFWPFHSISGQYLSEESAVAIFYAIGFAAILALMRAICRHYFPERRIWLVTATVLVFGLAMGLTISGCVYEAAGLTISGSVYEIAETCGFAFAMLALAAIWRAMHASPPWQAWWLLLASFAYGLAVGARPAILFGAIVLLAPVFQAWRQRAGSGQWPRVIILMAAAIVPIALVGFGLMLYNDLRFGNPLEFGWHYQLNQNDQASIRQFSLHYLWFDFWFYFLQPFGLSAHFPFLKSLSLPPLPPGHYARVTSGCGAILTIYPLVLLALAVPLAWSGTFAKPLPHGRGFVGAGLPAQTDSSLRWFAFALFSLFITVSFTLCLFFATNVRYGWDFLPELLMLSVIGFLSLERIVLPFKPWERGLRWGWRLLLAYSLIFNVLLNIEIHAKVDCLEGKIYLHLNRIGDAVAKYQKAAAIWPDDADAHYGLAGSFEELDRPDDAIAEFQKTLAIEPDYAPAHENLGYSFLKSGRLVDAVAEFQKTVELEPKNAGFHSDLAFCLYQMGQTAKAVEQWKLALQFMPDMTFAQVNLAWALATCPDASLRDGQTALALAERAYQLSNGRNPAVLRSLAAAFAEIGQYTNAVAAAQQALQMSRGNPGLAAAIQDQLKHYQNHQPYRDKTPIK